MRRAPSGIGVSGALAACAAVIVAVVALGGTTPHGRHEDRPAPKPTAALNGHRPRDEKPEIVVMHVIWSPSPRERTIMITWSTSDGRSKTWPTEVDSPFNQAIEVRRGTVINLRALQSEHGDLDCFFSHIGRGEFIGYVPRRTIGTVECWYTVA